MVVVLLVMLVDMRCVACMYANKPHVLVLFQSKYEVQG